MLRMSEQDRKPELPERLWTAEQVAEHLHKSPLTIRQWVKNRQIPFVRVGGTNLFRPSEIAAWIQVNSVAVSQPDAPQPDGEAA